MAQEKSYRASPQSRKKVAHSLFTQEKIASRVQASHTRKDRADLLSRNTVIFGIVLVCILLGWAIGLVTWGVAYISCGEAPITRRNELMIGTLYYKPGDEGYGLASPLFKGGYVCANSEEYRRATPPHLR